AAAAAFVLLAGAAVVQSVRVGDISTELAAERETVAALTEQLERPVLDSAVAQALGDPSSQRVVLGSQVSGSNAIIVLMPDGTGYLAEHTLQPLSADRTYQLWAIVDGKVISAGILGPEPGVVPFHIDPEGFQGFAITEEVIGGVTSSENDPVVAWLAA
ncbi:MAG: anti-sigma factor, partial [Acidimicrobiia bacterium]|nr:anti-sigma factor [Acidimicrobiia bacterium]